MMDLHGKQTLILKLSFLSYPENHLQR